MLGPYDQSWMFGGGMMLGGLLMILVWGIPLLLAFALVKYLFTKPGNDSKSAPKPEQTSPLDTLNHAYARGDISREEYLQKKNDIQS